ncbi:signal recognition particle, SRP9/SRP14 subunit [Lindgomyces ingoldianus]|uniref:Signal recognition particle, SRP9/SRP14 subunit n=1 Tax=Lindgomyces ingoldianus TaxID=673940 RepID=A0ACB6RHE8_9PLEO|nr:signal recognition particle, SRP9/SRP14 subunit [Lindgomyces ingoldianus]KAF2477942.1 signal recognition particle, SRP9/SRP14 subunit [Lindgomyces ingoldianus]
MPGEHMSNDEFFAKLTNLFELNRKKGHGSVYLTQKRMTIPPDTDGSSPAKVLDDPLWDTHPENPLPIIVRANNNKSSKQPGTDREDVNKIKISTLVQPDQLDAFYVRYAEVCKAGMSGLKKRDKKKKKKEKKKKKGGEGEAKG